MKNSTTFGLPLESPFFTWKSMSETQPGDLLFYEITLTSQLGEFPANSFFEEAFFLTSVSTLILTDSQGERFVFPLGLQVGNQLDKETAISELRTKLDQALNSDKNLN